jgi:hypothetical protein
MENSEQQERVIHLGKALVEELELNPGVDTLGRWMAHYVAEQMTVAEESSGDEKWAAEDRCFKTILNLWQHRSVFPKGYKPFEQFESIFNALDRLNPENPQTYYYFRKDINSSEVKQEDETSNEILQLVEMANIMDRSARIIIEYFFQQAALLANDEKTTNWINKAIGILPNDDISIIVRLMKPYENLGEETNNNENNQSEIIQSRVRQLDAFIALSQEIRSLLLEQIDFIDENPSSEEDIVK